MNIQIPTPCHENWERMLPDEKGRFCNACCKTVIDFTGMSPEAITIYLKEHSSQRVCGRFSTDQLVPDQAAMTSLTRSVWRSALSTIKKIAAIFLLLFAFSQQAQPQSTEAPKKDSSNAQHVKGKIAICPPKPERNDTKAPPNGNRNNKKPDEAVTEKKMITMGMIAIKPQIKQSL